MFCSIESKKITCLIQISEIVSTTKRVIFDLKMQKNNKTKHKLWFVEAPPHVVVMFLSVVVGDVLKYSKYSFPLSRLISSLSTPFVPHSTTCKQN